MTAEEMQRRGLRYAKPGERIIGPHVTRLPDGREVMNPAGTVNNAARAAGMLPAAPVAGMVDFSRGGAEAQRGEGLPGAPMSPAWARPGNGVPAGAGNMLMTEGSGRLPEAPAGLPAGAGNMLMTEGAGRLPEAPARLPAGAGNMLLTEGAGRLPAAPAVEPRLFVDSDGRARAGMNMGGEAGLVEADYRGVPIGTQMVPVGGLSQGSMLVGRDLAAGPAAPVALGADPNGLPAAPGEMNDRWARAAAEIGGFRAPEMNAREAARMADKDATRGARWDQSGPTSAVNRAVGQIRSQGAAMDALNRQTAAQIRLAQGTPQVQAGGAGVGAWDPVNRRVVTEMRPEAQAAGASVEERVAKLAQAYKAVSGKDIDPVAMMQVTVQQDPVKRKELLDKLTQGNPELSQVIAGMMQALMGGSAAPAGATGARAGAQDGAGAQGTGSTWDKYRRGGNR